MTSTISALAQAITIVPPIQQQQQLNGGGSNSSSNNLTVGTPTSSSIANNNNSNSFTFQNQIEEKVYKKEKQILIEFEAKTKGK